MWRTTVHAKVPGEGSSGAAIVCLGEGPGEEEDELGRPFVGRAGYILDRALYEAGLDRGDVWITNAARCRPLNNAAKNRTPTVQELGFCRGWLDDELALLPNKKIIVAMGASATWACLHPHQPTGGVLENQGKTFWSERYRCWVITSLHPAYILRKPPEILWLIIDLIQAQRVVATGQPPGSRTADIEIIDTLEKAFAVRDEILHRAQRLWWDWETGPGIGRPPDDSVHRVYAQGFCVAIAPDYRDNFAWVFPRFGQNFTGVWRPRELKILDQEVLAPIFLSDIPKGGHHVAFDANTTKSTIDVWPVNVDTCTMIAHHLINNHLGPRAHGLKRLSVLYTDYGRYDDDLDRWLLANGYVDDGKPDGAYIYKAPDAMVRAYNGTDAVVPKVAWPALKQKIEEADLWDVYTDERMPLALEYMRIDRRGVRVDEARLDRLGGDLGTAMEVVSGELTRLAGHALNFNSYPQVQKYLFEERGLPVIARTETGQPSTREEVLKEIEDMEPAIPLILHGRAYSKLKGTFVDGRKDAVGGLKAAIDPDGYARTDTMLHVTETFRLVTRKPLPIHTIPRPLVLWTCLVHGKYLFDKCCEAAIPASLNIRSLIIPDRGNGRQWHRFVDADFFAQEYILGAIIFKQADWEAAMIEQRRDPHEYVMELLSGRTKGEFGAEINGKWVWSSKAAEDDYKNLRSDWKRVNFMIFYRGGPKHLAASLSTKVREVTEDEAARMIEQYYERLPNVKWGQYNIIKHLRETGVVHSPFKTYRKLPGIWSPHYGDRADAERQGCNAPIQISGYHVMARAVIRLRDRWAGKPPLRAAYPAEVMFTIHDEIIAQAPHDLIEETQAMMVEEMSRPHRELVGGCGVERGIPADAKIVDAWGGLDEAEAEALEQERLAALLAA